MTSTAQRGLIEIIRGTAVSVWAGLKGTGQNEDAPGLLTMVLGPGNKGRAAAREMLWADPVPSPTFSPLGAPSLEVKDGARGAELPGRRYAGQHEGHTVGQRGEEPSTHG